MNSHEIDFARQVLVINSGIANIKLGIFVRLSKRYQEKLNSDLAVPLAYCIVHNIFLDPLNQKSLEEFARHNSQLIEDELHESLSDEELKTAVSLVYAVRLMLLGWQTQNPFSADANQLIERATEYSIDIPNIVETFGKDAVVSFFQFATDFTNESLQIG